MITRDDLRKLAPRARPEYVDAILSGLEVMREAGILDSPLRVSHFMAQVCHETGGFTIIRESLTYNRAQRLREVWPSRFRNKSDAELRHLVKAPVALGDCVYGGRMGNDQPGDGYAYRGGGFLQTTGKYAVQKYAAKLCIEPRPELLDDLTVTLRFACLEWKESGCNEWADENDIIKVSKAINTGSATSKVKPVNMQDRQRWFAKTWSIWGEKGTPDQYSKPVTVADVKDAAVTAAKVALPVGGGTVVADAAGVTPSPAALIGCDSMVSCASSFGVFAGARPTFIVAIMVGVAAIWLGPWLWSKVRG